MLFIGQSHGFKQMTTFYIKRQRRKAPHPTQINIQNFYDKRALFRAFLSSKDTFSAKYRKELQQYIKRYESNDYMVLRIKTTQKWAKIQTKKPQKGHFHVAKAMLLHAKRAAMGD